MKRTTLGTIRVRQSPLDRRRGRLMAGPVALPCALGRSGVTRFKREGDGATPAGRFPLIQVFWRPDALTRPATRLDARPLRPEDGWCDAPGDRRYNRLVRRPCAASHEALWREDGLYDLVVDIAWNRGPVRPGRGSAIFMHVARPGFAPTEGCVALERRALARLLARIGPRTRLIVG